MIRSIPSFEFLVGFPFPPQEVPKALPDSLETPLSPPPLSPPLVPLHTLGVFTQRLSPAGILFSLNGSCTFNSNVASAKFSQVLCRPCLLSGMYPRALSSFSVLALSTLSCNYLPCAPPPYRPTTSGEHVLIISLLWEPVTVPGTGWCPVSSWRKDCSGTPPKTPLYWLLSGHR